MDLHEAAELARGLMRQQGLIGWTFRFDHARRRFGSCNYTRRQISLSRPLTLLNDVEQVRETILHEIAHALTPGDGHGERWKRTCRKLGAAPRRCYTDQIVRSPPRTAAAFQIGCPACDWWHDRRRLTASRQVCMRCRGRVSYREKSSGRRFLIHPQRDGRRVEFLPG